MRKIWSSLFVMMLLSVTNVIRADPPNNLPDTVTVHVSAPEVESVNYTTGTDFDLIWSDIDSQYEQLIYTDWTGWMYIYTGASTMEGQIYVEYGADGLNPGVIYFQMNNNLDPFDDSDDANTLDVSNWMHNVAVISPDDSYNMGDLDDPNASVIVQALAGAASVTSPGTVRMISWDGTYQSIHGWAGSYSEYEWIDDYDEDRSVSFDNDTYNMLYASGGGVNFQRSYGSIEQPQTLIITVNNLPPHTHLGISMSFDCNVAGPYEAKLNYLDPNNHVWLKTAAAGWVSTGFFGSAGMYTIDDTCSNSDSSAQFRVMLPVSDTYDGTGPGNANDCFMLRKFFIVTY